MQDWLLFILRSLYLALPGVCANAAPVLARKIPFLDYPIDGGKMFQGQPLFGKNKTYRGFFFGILASSFVVYLQNWLYTFDAFRLVSIIDYSEMPLLLLGFLIGFGVLFGDLVKSFFKRRMKIKPGARFFPWDQLDSLIGGLLFVAWVFVPPAATVIFLLLAIPLIHVAVNHVAYYLGFKETKW